MNVAIRDHAAMSSLTHWGARAYLDSRGWIRQGKKRDRATVHVKEHAGRTWEVLIPLDDTAVDYAETMAQCVSVLSAVEERSQLVVFSDLSASNADVIAMRSMNGLARDSLSFRVSVELFDNAYNLLASAARAAEQPLATYRGRLSAGVREYLDHVVPVTGSLEDHVLTLHSPVAPAIGAGRLFGEVQPFSRQVTSKLAGALASATTVISKAVTNDASEDFETAIRAGLSSNLCDSVANLAKVGGGMEISLSWAPSRPAGTENIRLYFKEHSAEVLQEIAESFRQYEPSLGEHVQGQIVKIERKRHRSEEVVSISTVREGRQVVLDTAFESKTYSDALRAFKDRIPVSVYGDVYRVGRRYELRNPRNLTLWSGLFK